MIKKRKKHNPELMAEVALEAIQKKSKISEIARKYGVSSRMVNKWKDLLIEKSPSLFDDKVREYSQEQIDELYREIIRLKLQLQD